MKLSIRIFLIISLMGAGLASPLLATADSIFDPGGNIAKQLNLPQEDAESTFIRVVQYILGFVGLLAVIMLLYGGFRYLTSAGNEDAIKNAKAIIRTSLIGLLIVLFAQAIMLGAISILSEATT